MHEGASAVLPEMRDQGPSRVEESEHLYFESVAIVFLCQFGDVELGYERACAPSHRMDAPMFGRGFLDSRLYLHRIAYVDLVGARRNPQPAYGFCSPLRDILLRAVAHRDICARLGELDRHALADTAASTENDGGAIGEYLRHSLVLQSGDAA